MSEEQPTSGALDGPAARVAALFVALATAGVLVWIHRDDLFPGAAGGTAAAEDPAFAACYAERSDDIDRMRDEGAITAEQSALFKSRAEAMCRDAAEGGSGTPAVQ